MNILPFPSLSPDTNPTFQVTVGGPTGLVYSPDSVQANQHDMVQFNFMSKNHTVTQSTFPKPCNKMPVMPGMPEPIDSGFMPYDGNGNPPMMMVQVTGNASMPMWFYCRQKTPKPHCGGGNGMTFSINPNQPGQGAKTQAAFKASAMMQASNNSAGMGSAMASGGAAAASGGMMNMPDAAAATQQSAAVATNAATSQNQASGSTSQNQAGGSSASPNNALMAQGTGQSSTGGACECSCLCGAASFPNAMQGIGMMGGGFPGKLFSPYTLTRHELNMSSQELYPPLARA